MTHPDDQSLMQQYLWTHRPLLIFAPTPDDARLNVQRRIARDADDGFADRQMLLIEIIAAGDSRIVRPGDASNPKPISDIQVNEIRRRFRPSVTGFTVMLIGKDGGVKLRKTEPVTADELFALIDAMPMRIRETQRQRD